MVLKQDTNEPSEEFTVKWEEKVNLESGKHRIEIHVYTNEWMSLANELNSYHSLPLDNFDYILGLATKLLIIVTEHVNDLAKNWFPRMFRPMLHQRLNTYLPCWKCWAEIGKPKPLDGGMYIQ